MVHVSKQEKRKVIGIVFIILSFGLMGDTIKEFVTNIIPISPFLIGLIVLITGVVFFEIA